MSGNYAKLKGEARVLARIAQEVEGTVKRGRAALLGAGLIVEGEAKKRVPVEKGNLRASGYTQMDPNGKLYVRVGFSAAYALWVHESIGMVLRGKPRPSGIGQYWGPKGEARFLANALTAKKTQVVAYMTKTMSQKGGQVSK